MCGWGSWVRFFLVQPVGLCHLWPALLVSLLPWMICTGPLQGEQMPQLASHVDLIWTASWRRTYCIWQAEKRCCYLQGSGLVLSLQQEVLLLTGSPDKELCNRFTKINVIIKVNHTYMVNRFWVYIFVIDIVMRHVNSWSHFSYILHCRTEGDVVPDEILSSEKPEVVTVRTSINTLTGNYFTHMFSVIFMCCNSCLWGFVSS